MAVFEFDRVMRDVLQYRQHSDQSYPINVHIIDNATGELVYEYHEFSASHNDMEVLWENVVMRAVRVTQEEEGRQSEVRVWEGGNG